MADEDRLKARRLYKSLTHTLKTTQNESVKAFTKSRLKSLEERWPGEFN